MLNLIGPKETFQDVVFTFIKESLSVINFGIHVMPLERHLKSSEKVDYNYSILKSIERKFFFKNVSSKYINPDFVLYFFYDPQNQIDYCNIVIYDENLSYFEVYDYSGKTILDGHKAIYESFSYSAESALLKYLYTNDLSDKIECKGISSVLKNGQYLKSGVGQFIELLNKENIYKLYHFTDRSNIASIKKQGGLYSWFNCQERDINVCFPGGDSLSKTLDLYHNLEDFVRLSFNQNNPMMYTALRENRIIDPVILEINPDVILWYDTRFSNMNATKNGHVQGPSFNHFKSINFSIARNENYLNLSTEDKLYFQAEVLVKSFVPIDYITNINQIVD